MTLSAGTLEDPNSIKPQVVVFAKNRNHWDVMDSTLETFDDMPDWKPEIGDEQMNYQVYLSGACDIYMSA